MGHCQARIQSGSPLRGCSTIFYRSWRAVAELRMSGKCPSQPQGRRRKRRIKAERLLEIRGAFLEARPVVTVYGMTALQVDVIGIYIVDRS
jgi:hypothetical protein